VNKVEMRQRLVKMFNYKRAMKEKAERQETEAFWRRWLVEGLAGEKGDLENYAVTVAEQTESHVILRAVPDEVQNYLGKYGDRFPGLELKASTHRTYPYGHAACHLMGRVSKVSHDDLKAADNPTEETRQYLPSDQIGRGGVEALLERALRGTKGKVVKLPGQDTELSREDPVQGQHARITIDVELQARLEAAFTSAELLDPRGTEVVETATFHGAAVLIDVPTGEVLAMASYPTYDLNTFDELYDQLYADEVNKPLLNRATQSQLQPGSTMKPIVGFGAISQGMLGADHGIECSGYLVIDGRKKGVGRCWVASQFANNPLVPSVAHHPIPVPHPTGFLTFGDALERSCNVYFETLADRMGLEGLSVWGERFGLGRVTGVGIAEARGRLPRAYADDGPAIDRRYRTWFAGIGQDPVAATPIQMANVAATIARGGVWRRPRLVSADEAKRLGVALPDLKPADPLRDDGRPGGTRRQAGGGRELARPVRPEPRPGRRRRGQGRDGAGRLRVGRDGQERGPAGPGAGRHPGGRQDRQRAGPAVRDQGPRPGHRQGAEGREGPRPDRGARAVDAGQPEPAGPVVPGVREGLPGAVARMVHGVRPGRAAAGRVRGDGRVRRERRQDGRRDRPPDADRVRRAGVPDAARRAGTAGGGWDCRSGGWGGVAPRRAGPVRPVLRGMGVPP
jgi:cell division protein FtsI/penicillin-binding protein 2